jgi:hypothetical protein
MLVVWMTLPLDLPYRDSSSWPCRKYCNGSYLMPLRYYLAIIRSLMLKDVSILALQGSDRPGALRPRLVDHCISPLP